MVNPEMPSVQTIVASQIVAVTVYSDKALVTRRGVVSLTGQETELVIAPLPDTTETESVRVSGKGEIPVRLLEARCDRIFSTEPVAAKVAHLTQQIQQLEAEWQHLQAQIDALALQSSFIQGLREKTEEQFSISLARKNLSFSETLDFLNFLGSQYTEYGISTTECKNRQKELEQQLQSLRQQLQTVKTPHPKETYSLSVAIEPEGEGEFELEVSYIVHRASWTPLYDLRLCSTNNIVNLSYLAEVTQNSGEDWLGVALTLSTAKPGLGTLPPKLEPWYIDVPRSNPELRRVRRRRTPMLPMTAAAPASDAPEEEDYELLEENFIAAETVVAEVTKEGSVVNFKLDGNGNIPSDGTPHKTTIFQDDFPCHFSYVAMPRLVSFAYLQAHIKNNSNGATLLPGKANIFRDNIFVGTTKLENIAPGQEFKVNLGIDEGLKIERDLIERQVDKKLIGNNSRIIYAYRLLITNLLTQQVDLKLTEQLPVSRSEQIKVRLLRCNPQIQLGEMGRLEWDMIISAQAKQEIYYQFAVEHPPQLTVVGLDI
ncbi:MAG: mucoidy inhibitor MuiA family protein [Chlorogloeopsis fritschii C42_A2020_084]|uniref:mucoidy inhibitor MuiA family protein n=1 Tax=Chlorogloeopsis fritschii TaxID=1124 RepID=UPI0019E64DA0|nr:mucoidy inhibitor MuiA family protein [Chlorogloeopsis fritschii]MBF2007582.1 mucoidy inhibitor MuiA family protein [Chlorogloeopsis fritschii C42_A2020_084]